VIEKYIDCLDDVNKKIMRMFYFEGTDADKIAAAVYISRRAVYYRIDSFINGMKDAFVFLM
jgi:DNA-directed RNA polymerase specialized sigma subunit